VKRRIDKAMSFGWDGKRVIVYGEHIEMRVNKSDAYRLALICVAADPKFSLVPTDFVTWKVKK
jgi:hypothetical protein